MGKFLSRIFTWWSGSTIGTLVYTKRRGQLVGRDIDRNQYYQDAATGRRWVVYYQLSEPTLVPAQWYAWLHGMVDEPPADDDYAASRPNRLPNLSGTKYALTPSSSLRAGGYVRAVSADYRPWKPSEDS